MEKKLNIYCSQEKLCIGTVMVRSKSLLDRTTLLGSKFISEQYNFAETPTPYVQVLCSKCYGPLYVECDGHKQLLIPSGIKVV